MAEHETASFNRGYLLAVSNLMNLHDAEVEATDVLRELGISRRNARKLGLTDYDWKALSPIFRNLESRP